MNKLKKKGATHIYYFYYYYYYYCCKYVAILKEKIEAFKM